MADIPKSIVIIEDDVSVSKAIARYFESTEIEEVDLFEDGNKAWEAMQQNYMGKGLKSKTQTVN